LKTNFALVFAVDLTHQKSHKNKAIRREINGVSCAKVCSRTT